MKNTSSINYRVSPVLRDKFIEVSKKNSISYSKVLRKLMELYINTEGKVLNAK